MDRVTQVARGSEGTMVEFWDGTWGARGARLRKSEKRAEIAERLRGSPGGVQWSLQGAKNPSLREGEDLRKTCFSCWGGRGESYRIGRGTQRSRHQRASVMESRAPVRIHAADGRKGSPQSLGCR